jgi:DNA-binding NarL/FixJ family response regulator
VSPSSEPEVTVLLADDHVATRRGVRSILESDGFRVVAEADNAIAAVAAARELSPMVCILDVAMPGGGIAAAARIRQNVPESRVIMLTVSGSRDDLLEALRAGAAGYLLKSMNPERLPHAIRGVLAGEAAIPRELVSKLLVELRNSSPGLTPAEARRFGLSAREVQVLGLLEERHGTAEIASRLGISATTVRRHLSAAIRKLEVRDRTEAVDALRQIRSSQEPG